LYIAFVVNNPFRLQSKTSVCIKQWLCYWLAACGSKWQGVALFAYLQWLFQASVMQRKAKSGIIQSLHTCVAAFGIGLVASGVLLFPKCLS